jgi:small redox-active disulfide protein 2
MVKMEIKVVGPGCTNCKNLLEVVKRAVKELDLEIEVEYVTDIQKMVEMDIMQTPALAINDKVVLSGFVPDIKTVKNKIKENE